MPLSGKELLRLLAKHGWKVVRVRGSHHTMQLHNKRLVIPVHGNKSLPKGTERSILKRAGVKK